ncbi:MAG: hypothetical protein IKI45_06645 [Oscillospiraceae bacterium]|nr:hypothetical protein [Oscillospiraceae bacterium]
MKYAKDSSNGWFYFAVAPRGRPVKDKCVFTGKIRCKAHGIPYWRTSHSNSILQENADYAAEL